MDLEDELYSATIYQAIISRVGTENSTQKHTLKV